MTFFIHICKKLTTCTHTCKNFKWYNNLEDSAHRRKPMYTAFLSEYTTEIPPLPFLNPESHIQGGIASCHAATAEPYP